MKNKLQKLRALVIGAAILLLAVSSVAPESARAQDLVKFEQRMTEFTLGNGLTFLILERHEAPVVSFHTYADVGAVDEVRGITGMAHLFEHMAFKGTKTIGTKDYAAEVETMAKIDEAFLALKAEQRKGERADKARLEQLQNAMKEAQEQAQQYLVLTSTKRCSRARAAPASTRTQARMQLSTSSVFRRIRSSGG